MLDKKSFPISLPLVGPVFTMREKVSVQEVNDSEKWKHSLDDVVLKLQGRSFPVIAGRFNFQRTSRVTAARSRPNSLSLNVMSQKPVPAKRCPGLVFN
ncbi:hypothetical protein Bpfe_016367 [Biomphalaria pfeifferi]|uniref:Uncharacterized protein n=1 Tax=Biomphalaria pfeifferi TaxID=112525 RepID=A0AAD8BGF8_BIOPF|nr:hypothetical protein Bpfe_016367 [Biomphalaria pfeifferi]